MELSSTGFEGVESHGASVRISFRLDGRKIRERLENVPDTPQGWKQAAGIRKKIIQRIEAGAYRRADFFSDARRETQKTAAIFDDFAPLWIAERTLHVKPATIKAYKHIVARFSKKFGKRRMLDIDYLDIAQFLADLKVSAKTRNNYRITLRGIFGLAVDCGYIDTDPTARLKNEKTERPEILPLTTDERDRILGHMQKHYPATVYHYFLFAFGTGLRPSEMIALRWGDVDFAKRTVFVTRALVGGAVQPTKTRARWPVRLTELAFQALMLQRPLTYAKGADAPVFENPATNKGWSDDQRQRRLFWTPALHACGIRHRDAYNTRHTFATCLLMAGVAPAYIASQLGHTTSKMIYERYATWIPGALQDDAEAAKAAAALSSPTMPGALSGPNRAQIFG